MGVISVERFLAYSDAYFSIIATLIVTSLVHLEPETVKSTQECDSLAPEQRNGCATLQDVLMNKLISFAVYFMAFHFISRHWRDHAATMTGVEKMTTATTAANVLGLFPAVAALPATTSVGAVYYVYNAWAGALIFANALLLCVARCWVNYTLIRDSDVGLLILNKKSMVIGHSSRQDSTPMPSRFLRDTPAHFYNFTTAAVNSSCFLAFACIGIATDAHSSDNWWWTIILYVGGLIIARHFTPIIASRLNREIHQAVVRLHSSTRKGLSAKLRKQNDPALQRAARSFSLNRMEAFADGVFAIVATLIILEIKPPLASSDNVNKPIISLSEWWHEENREVVAATCVLLLVGSLWVLHAISLNFLSRAGDIVSGGAVRVNSWLLSVVGVIPFTMSLVIDFPSSNLAVQIFATVLLVLSASYAALTFYANFTFNREYKKRKRGKLSKSLLFGSPSGTQQHSQLTEMVTIEDEHSAQNEKTLTDTGADELYPEKKIPEKEVEQHEDASDHEYNAESMAEFKKVRNQILVKLLCFTLASLTMLFIGIANHVHEWAIPIVLAVLVVSLASELLTESMTNCTKRLQSTS